MKEENYDALFNPQTEVPDSGTTNNEEYSPSAQKGKNNVYQSIIRFVPWWKNPKQSVIDKWTCWLTDPVTERGRFVDCPSSIGKPSVLQDMFWKLKKSESVALQKKAQIFSRRHSFTALIQVIKDENNPELEGKILAWRFGVKIWEKINAELKPVIGERHDPFDILNGKVFALVITKVKGFNNYDQAKFHDKKVPLCIPNDEGKLVPISPDTDKRKVFEWVKENSPDLDKYSFKEWDQETYDYVNHVIGAVTGEASVSKNYSSLQNKETEEGDKDSGGIESSDISSEDLNLDSDDTNMPDIDMPDLPKSEGISGNLDDALKDL